MGSLLNLAITHVTMSKLFRDGNESSIQQSVPQPTSCKFPVLNFFSVLFPVIFICQILASRRLPSLIRPNLRE
jgi:hypothetical protein